MNELEKAFKEIVTGMYETWQDRSPRDEWIEDYWQTFVQKAGIASPAHMEPPKWTQEKPVEVGLYRNWSERGGFAGAYFEVGRSGQLEDMGGFGANHYPPNLWWLRIEDVAPPEVGS